MAQSSKAETSQTISNVKFKNLNIRKKAKLLLECLLGTQSILGGQRRQSEVTFERAKLGAFQVQGPVL